MKRWMWTVGAVVTIAVIVAVFALAYQPVPFGFMRGAELVQMEEGVVFGPPPDPPMTHLSYELHAGFEDTVRAARSELVNAGWTVESEGSSVWFENSGYRMINVAMVPDKSGGEKVLIQYFRPTQPTDKFANWVFGVTREARR